MAEVIPDDDSRPIVEIISELIYQGRYLAASKAWKAHEEAVMNGSKPAIISDDAHTKTINDLQTRVAEVKNALAMEDVSDDWTFGIAYFGITTHYKVSPDNSGIIVRMEGHLELPIFEQCAAVHEVDLFHTWLPFCSDSQTICKLQPAELIAYICLSVPPISRDTLLRAYGADCLQEEGKVVLIGSSIDTWIQSDGEDNINVPFKQEGWFHKRMVIKKFEAIVHVLSPNSGKTIVIAEVCPRIRLPQVFVNFIIRNMAGVFLYLLQCQAIKISAEKDCLHNQRIRGNKEFYRDWLYAKLERLCLSHGWETPKVAAFSNDFTGHDNLE